MKIQIDCDVLTDVHNELRKAATSLRGTAGVVSSSVPGGAFGPVGFAVPPAINGVGGAVEGFASFVADRIDSIAKAMEATCKDFTKIEDDAVSRFKSDDHGGSTPEPRLPMRTRGIAQ